MANANFNTLASTTLNNHMPKLIDNVFSARPFSYFLKQAGQIRMVNGGQKIVIPLLYGVNDTAASYADYDDIAVTAQTGITSAEFAWKQYAATVAISGIEEAKNNGEEAVIDLLEAKIMQAEETIVENFDNMFITGDGTGNSGKDWDGLASLVSDQTSSIGGIDPDTAGDSYWKASKNTTAGVLSIADMNTAFNNASVGADQPNMVLTTQTLYEKYEALLQPQLRFTDSKSADAGFQNLLFKGSPVFYDTYVPTGFVYFLNTKYLRLVGHTQNWFKTTPFIKPHTKDARYAQIICYGNLTISNRKRQALLTARTG